jgi:ABC-type transport system substrate-binding protein
MELQPDRLVVAVVKIKKERRLRSGFLPPTAVGVGLWRTLLLLPRCDLSRWGSVWLLAISSASSAAYSPSVADPSKVLRVVFAAAETGYDPAATQDLYSSQVEYVVFDTLYSYDYLARPAKVTPRAASGMPEVSPDGKTYTVHLKPGIYFTPDPAFGGKRRELIMADFVYAYKRLLDPRVHSPNSWIFDGKIVGMDAVLLDAKKTGHFNYDMPVAGFELVDRYTLRLHLTRPDFNMAMLLGHTPTSAVAREVIERYQDSQGWAMAHPVGTGPYMVTAWTPSSTTILTANPAYRTEYWNFAAGTDPEDQGIVAAMNGKRIPQIGRIEISDINESQSSWLAFQKKEADLMQLGDSLVTQVLKDGKLTPELAKTGIHLSRFISPWTYYYYWNMRDPVLGGLSKEKIALRRAIAMAYDPRVEIAVALHGNGIPIDYPIPPGVVGYDPHYKSILHYDPRAANALLDRYGYKVGADGWRTQPNGKPLNIHYAVLNGSSGQVDGEMWKKIYDSLHMHMTVDVMLFPDLLKAETDCHVQSRTNAWVADYPDGDDFMMLYYSANIHGSNNSCVDIPEYDVLYRQSAQMPAGPARDALYHKMTRVLETYGAIRMGYASYSTFVAQAKVIGFKKHPVIQSEWAFLDIDNSK